MATKKYDDEKRIVLFKNDKFGEKDQPIYRGYTWVNGVKFNISMWAQKDQNGKLYFQGQLQTTTNNPDAVQEAQLELEEIDKAISVDA